MRIICTKLDFFSHDISNGCSIFCTEKILSISDIFSTLPYLPSSEDFRKLEEKPQ